MENIVANHLSRLTIAHNTHNPPINDEFLEESLLLIESTPWYAHIANHLATGELLEGTRQEIFLCKNSLLLLGRALLVQILY